MGQVINLKRFKKRVERDQSDVKAAANRARFGRTKSERASSEKAAKRTDDLLDQHHLKGEDAS